MVELSSVLLTSYHRESVLLDVGTLWKIYCILPEKGKELVDFKYSLMFNEDALTNEGYNLVALLRVCDNIYESGK